jgi:hypothetical protein
MHPQTAFPHTRRPIERLSIRTPSGHRLRENFQVRGRTFSWFGEIAAQNLAGTLETLITLAAIQPAIRRLART